MNPAIAKSMACALLVVLVACNDGDESRKPSRKKQPKQPTIHSVTLTPGELTLPVGGSGTLEVEVTGEGEFDDTVNWASSDEAVATVVDGVVTAVAAGSVEITATSVADPERAAGAKVTVEELPPSVGTLEVEIRGLPEGMEAALQVSGPEGYSTTLDQPARIDDLVPGPYTVTAKELEDDAYRYIPTATRIPVEVEAGKTTEVTVDFDPIGRYFRLSSDGTVIPLVGTAQLHVELARFEGFKGPVDLRFDRLPEGFSADPVTIEEGEDEATMVLHSVGSVRKLGSNEARLVAEGRGARVRTHLTIQVEAIVTVFDDEGPGTLRNYLEIAPELIVPEGEHMTIRFAPSEGEVRIPVTKPLTVSRDMAIEGRLEDGEPAIVLDANSASSILTVEPGVHLEIHRMHFTNGFDWDVAAVTNHGALKLTDTWFTSNTKSGALESTGTLEVDRGHFKENEARLGGGGIKSSGTLTVRDSFFIDNRTSLYGGGILIDEGSATIERTLFEENSASLYGGGVYVDAPDGQEYEKGDYTLRGDALRFVNNYADGRGGGLGVDQNALVFLTSSEFLENEGQSGAGAMRNVGTIWMEGCSLIDNKASGAGGAISNLGVLRIWNSTISGNRGWNKGAAIHNAGAAGDARIFHSTLSANHGTDSGGLYVEAPIVVGNTIIFGNTSTNGTADVAGDASLFTSEGHNFLGEIFSSEPSVLLPSDREGVDPVIFDLGDHGGPTKTHALLPQSPAVNHVPPELCVDPWGEPLLTDQRGNPRPAGAGCDSGAYELQHAGP